MATQYTQHYSNFIGVDMSSDPRAVARNRLAYCINMWRDYESEQGACVETFPGFRRAAHSLGLDGTDGEIGAIHGIYHFRSRKGADYVVAHAGTKLYAFEVEALARGDYEDIANRSAIISEGVADNDSTGFIYNNNLYILDGSHYLTVTSVDGDGAAITASAVDAYIPTTYYNGKMYEQRNMLTTAAVQVETQRGEECDHVTQCMWYDMVYHDIYSSYIKGYKKSWHDCLINGTKYYRGSSALLIPDAKVDPKYDINYGIFRIQNLGGNADLQEIFILQNNGHFFDVDGTQWSRTYRYLVITEDAFRDCPNLERVYLHTNSSGTDTQGRPEDGGQIQIKKGAFAECDKLTDIYFYHQIDLNNEAGYTAEDKLIIEEEAIPDGVRIHYLIEEPPSRALHVEYTSNTRRCYKVCELAKRIKRVSVGFDKKDVPYYYLRKNITLNGEEIEVVDSIHLHNADIVDENNNVLPVNIELELYPTHFTTVEGVKNFNDGNTNYKKTSFEAINGCTKSAVYDGRVFLTGNPELPNTVFYSHRNLTGANDPAYFGVYNYFNDGEGNTPNVDIISTPSMLMVIKGDTAQDGSVYYHVGANNTDEQSMHILPRIYPSTQGAAGLGSAGRPVPSRLSINFFDDPVFLSKRGLEAVGKETVNLERTIQHRSSNIDRLLIKEDLSSANMTEWKGYLVICCNGHIYLADSRYMIQHNDGSYQYEWYYLEGVGTYEDYAPRWAYWLDAWPLMVKEGVGNVTLDEFLTLSGERVGDTYALHSAGDLGDGAVIMVASIKHPSDESYIIDLYYVEQGGVKYVVGVKSDEKVGVGEFFGVTRVITVGERLIFGTAHGDICIVNTDRRDVETGMIDRSFYSFAGVAYRSGCSLRLDDCDMKSFTKNTLCGTTTAVFKMMPGSHCKVKLSFDGCVWQELGEAFSSRFDFGDIQFSNFSFTDNSDNVVVLPEISRGWVSKQYYFYSDGFEAPFGLYELSYIYYASGKIRY